MHAVRKLPNVWIKFLLLMLFFFLGLLSQVKANEIQVKLIRPLTAEQIPELKFLSDSIEIQTESTPLGEQAFIDVKGTFIKHHWSLLYKKQKITQNKNGEFQLRVKIQGKKSSFQILLIGPKGQLKSEVIQVVFEKWESFKQETLLGPKRTSLGLSLGMSLSYLSYKELGIDPRLGGELRISATALTGKISFARPLFLGNNWTYGVSSYFTMFSLTKNYTPTIRFIGVNFRVGWTFPFIADPWKIGLHGGMYYTTTIVSGNKYGFKNMAGPQLYPTVLKKLRNEKAILTYFKFSPVTSGSEFLKFKNRELAMGGAYILPLKNAKSFSYTVDIAYFQLIAAGATLSSTSYSLGFNYGF